jgi:hypothetical protein
MMTGVDRNGPKRFSVQRVKQLVVHGDLAHFGFQPGDFVVAVTGHYQARQSAFWDLSEAQPIRSLHSTNNKAPLKGGAKLTVRGSGLPTLASRIE